MTSVRLWENSNVEQDHHVACDRGSTQLRAFHDCRLAGPGGLQREVLRRFSERPERLCGRRGHDVCSNFKGRLPGQCLEARRSRCMRCDANPFRTRFADGDQTSILIQFGGSRWSASAIVTWLLKTYRTSMAVTSSSKTHICQIPVTGAGVGLKPEHAEDILMGPRRVDFFEIHAENYMG